VGSSARVATECRTGLRREIEPRAFLCIHFGLLVRSIAPASLGKGPRERRHQSHRVREAPFGAKRLF
jgi:hypothetical protein